ncbi:MAG: alpha/beta fold hydrolase [Gammaproteobacteria bacterium]
MERPQLTPAITLLGLALTQCGCVTVDVRLAGFMSPDRAPRTAALARGYAVQDLVIHRGDRLIGITHAHNVQSQAIIVFCGGDSFHRSIDGAEALEALARSADVVLFDYPGYGESTGALSPSVIVENALAVYDYAVALETSAGKKRVLYGFSLGGMVAAQIAQQRAPDGIVLEATAPSVEAWARSQIPWYAKSLVTPRIEPALASVDTLVSLRHFEGEVLVLAGRSDRQAPPPLSVRIDRELRRSGVRSQLLQFPRARHGSIPHAPEFGPALGAFLDRVKVPQ